MIQCPLVTVLYPMNLQFTDVHRFLFNDFLIRLSQLLQSIISYMKLCHLKRIVHIYNSLAYAHNDPFRARAEVYR